MLNKNLFLSNNIFEKNCKKNAVRNGWGEGVLECGKLDKSVVSICADVTESVRLNLFKNEFPGRFVEVGVAEQNMATLASGMAAYGKIPFISSYAVFSPGRNWEQIKTTICLNNQKVIIGGGHAGISVGPDGATHQALEDIALMRVLPNMSVFSPCDYHQAKKITINSLKVKGPSYIRLARNKTPLITTPKTPFEAGKGQVFWEGDNPKVLLISTGPVVYQALLAAKELKQKDGIESIVVNIHTLKPIDKDLIIDLSKKTKAVVSVEDHQIAGGLGSLVSEVLSESYPTAIEYVGIKDRFGQSGSAARLYEEYGLTHKDIISASKKVLSRRDR